ncbi:MAG: SDR family NAD(P)-dependent oxidoreductase [Ferruginibacter sp.]
MKTIIITGVTGNLGKAVAEKFISKEYKVIGTVLPNDPVQLNFPGGNFETYPVDLLDETASQEFVNTVLSKHGSIDATVLTVGGFATGTIADTAAADISKQYQLNFETAYNIARPVFNQMLKQNDGRIFIIGARAGLRADMSKGMIAYGLAKSMLLRLAELMNLEAKGYNVVTSVVIPSTIDTAQNRAAIPAGNFDSWVKPADIADIIYFHTSAEASILRETVIKAYNNA